MTSRPLRVYLIDPSSSDQGLIAAALSESTALVLVGTARQVGPGTRELRSIGVDAVLIEVERDGREQFDELSLLQRSLPRVPIVVFSRALARPGVAVQAMAHGARACVPKPAIGRDSEQARLEIAKDLNRALLQICGGARLEESASDSGAFRLTSKLPAAADGSSASRARVSTPALSRAPPPGTTLRPGPQVNVLPGTYLFSRPPSAEATEAVVIAASTGGLPALACVIAGVGARFAAPVIISQHMLPSATLGVLGHLARMAGTALQEVSSGALLDSNRIWLAPGGRHVVVLRGARGVILELRDDPPRNSCRPSADLLFESAAQVFGARLLGVVLTGIGRDGLDGCRAIRAAGGRVIVQDEATSVAWGMPGSIHKAGLADAVLPIEQIGATIRRWGTPSVARSGGGLA